MGPPSAAACTVLREARRWRSLAAGLIGGLALLAARAGEDDDGRLGERGREGHAARGCIRGRSPSAICGVLAAGGGLRRGAHVRRRTPRPGGDGLPRIRREAQGGEPACVAGVAAWTASRADDVDGCVRGPRVSHEGVLKVLRWAPDLAPRATVVPAKGGHGNSWCRGDAGVGAWS